MVLDVLEPVVEAVAGNIEGFSTLVFLVIGARWLHRGARIGTYFQILAYFAGFLAVLMVAGVVEGFNPGRILDFGTSLVELLADLAGTILVAGGAQ